MDIRRAIRRTTLGIVVAATWTLAGRQFSRGPLELLPFTGPGALAGLALGWLSHAFLRDRYTWTRGRGAAVLGALMLPPWLVALVGAAGMTVADGAAVVVVGAWTVLFAGSAIAVMRWALHRVDRDLVRERMRRVPTLDWRSARRRMPRSPSRPLIHGLASATWHFSRHSSRNTPDCQHPAPRAR